MEGMPALPTWEKSSLICYTASDNHYTLALGYHWVTVNTVLPIFHP